MPRLTACPGRQCSDLERVEEHQPVTLLPGWRGKSDFFPARHGRPTADEGGGPSRSGNQRDLRLRARAKVGMPTEARTPNDDSARERRLGSLDDPGQVLDRVTHQRFGSIASLAAMKL